MVALLIALFAGTVLEVAVFYGLLRPFHVLPADLPRSIPIISALLTAFWITGSRVAIRIAFMMANRSDVSVKRRRVIIAGAGVAGAMTAKELTRNMQLGIEPIGFVDDDRLKQGRHICGIPVYGRLADLPDVLRFMKSQRSDHSHALGRREGCARCGAELPECGCSVQNHPRSL